MARKKKARARKKKLSKKLDKDTRTPDGLSAREFATLAHQYKDFTVEDSNHENITFSLRDIAYIRWQDREDNAVVPEEDYWIGEILDIRGNDPTDVWVHVQWFWSPQEVAEVIQSFDPAICGDYEKLSSDNTDVISVHCFVTHVDVKLFDETSTYQTPIGENEWFIRWHFLYNAMRISPKVAHYACPICKVPYTPGKEKILHFCPHPHCCKFYHQACLVKNGYVEETLSHRLLETWPIVDRTIPVELLSNSCPPRKRQKVDYFTSRSDCDPLVGFPEQLIAVADQQIIRGTQEGGIVGNITSVVAARQLIYKTICEGDIIPDNWEAIVDVSLPPSEPEIYPNTICPSCLSPI